MSRRLSRKAASAAARVVEKPGRGSVAGPLLVCVTGHADAFQGNVFCSVVCNCGSDFEASGSSVAVQSTGRFGGQARSTSAQIRHLAYNPGAAIFRSAFRGVVQDRCCLFLVFELEFRLHGTDPF